MDSKTLSELVKLFGEKNVNLIDEKTDWSKLPDLINKEDLENYGMAHEIEFKDRGDKK